MKYKPRLVRIARADRGITAVVELADAQLEEFLELVDFAFTARTSVTRVLNEARAARSKEG